MANVRVSLANKCQILFGLAVLIIIAAALSVPWIRMQKLLDHSQQEIGREIADEFLHGVIHDNGTIDPVVSPVVSLDAENRLERRIRLVHEDSFETEAESNAFFAEALERFESSETDDDELRRVRPASRFEPIRYRYARAVRRSDLERHSGFAPSVAPMQVVDPLVAVVLVDMSAAWASTQVLLNRIYILIAGLLAGALAIVTFWLITTRIILSPVRVLRSTAEKVADGDLNIRSDINTGDEYEQLSDAFNSMLGTLKSSQEQLQSLNKQLDLKLGELAESNVSLFEANRLKNDFLANVSHELRTPLNSIIGFGEVLMDDENLDEKRQRYVQNIITSSRSLLVMINELLDLAKIEAGRVDLHVEPMVVGDVCEALINLIRPQSEPKKIELRLQVDKSVPIVQTDAGKFQQVIFNFLSNAVKFTPTEGRVELIAQVERDDAGEPSAVRISVRDNGPGIAVENHEIIFEKFRQLDEAHTKLHGGTGLGLAISKELARLLDGRIELESDLGKGATFTLVLQLALEEKSKPLMPQSA